MRNASQEAQAWPAHSNGSLRSRPAHPRVQANSVTVTVSDSVSVTGPGSGVRSPGSGVRGPGFGVRHPGAGIRGPGSGIRGPAASSRPSESGHGLGLGHGLRLGLGQRLRCLACASIPSSCFYGWLTWPWG